MWRGEHVGRSPRRRGRADVHAWRGRRMRFGGRMRAHAGGRAHAGACWRMRAQARGTPAGGCTKGAGGWMAILTGAGRAVGVGAAAGVNALLAGPPERSRAERAGQTKRSGSEGWDRQGTKRVRHLWARRSCCSGLLICRVPDSVIQECCRWDFGKYQLYACCSSKSELKFHGSAESAYEVCTI